MANGPGPTEDVLLRLMVPPRNPLGMKKPFPPGCFLDLEPHPVDPESDAATLFGPVLDLEGNISYGDAPGWHVDLILKVWIQGAPTPYCHDDARVAEIR